MRYSDFELTDGRININFSVHSFLKQWFSSSTFLFLEQAMRVQTAAASWGTYVVCWLWRVNKQFDWIDLRAIAILTGVAPLAVYSRDHQEKAP